MPRRSYNSSSFLCHYQRCLSLIICSHCLAASGVAVSWRRSRSLTRSSSSSSSALSFNACALRSARVARGLARQWLFLARIGAVTSSLTTLPLRSGACRCPHWCYARGCPGGSTRRWCATYGRSAACAIPTKPSPRKRVLCHFSHTSVNRMAYSPLLHVSC